MDRILNSPYHPVSLENLGKPIKVTLCGSTKFKDGFMALQHQLGIEGVLVYSVEVFGHADGIIHTRQEKAVLDALHLHKILESDMVIVITDPNQYIGESTEREVEWARMTGKLVIMYAFGRDSSDELEQLKDLSGVVNPNVGEEIKPVADDFHKETHDNVS